MPQTTKEHVEAINRKGFYCYLCGLSTAGQSYISEADGHVRHCECDSLGDLLYQAKEALYAAALVCAKGDGLSYLDRKDAHTMVLQAIAAIGSYQADQEETYPRRLRS